MVELLDRPTCLFVPVPVPALARFGSTASNPSPCPCPCSYPPGPPKPALNGAVLEICSRLDGLGLVREDPLEPAGPGELEYFDLLAANPEPEPDPPPPPPPPPPPLPRPPRADEPDEPDEEDEDFSHTMSGCQTRSGSARTISGGARSSWRCLQISLCARPYSWCIDIVSGSRAIRTPLAPGNPFYPCRCSGDPSARLDIQAFTTVVPSCLHVQRSSQSKPLVCHEAPPVPRSLRSSLSPLELKY